MKKHAKATESKKNLEMTDIFLLSMIASLLSSVVLCTFIFLMNIAIPSQRPAIYWTSIIVILFISTIAAFQYSYVNK